MQENKNIIALVEPEIPSNTGNIARTCVLTGTELHLIEPLGFSLEDKYLKRAGLDYWPALNIRTWPGLEAYQVFLEEAEESYQIYYATTKAEKDLRTLEISKPSILVFGKETKGLPEDFVKAHPERGLRIPMRDYKRSLNLSNSAAILIYEVLRQQGYPTLV